MLIYIFCVVAIAAFVTAGVMEFSQNEDHIVPEAFEKHDHEEVEEINASERPLDWWVQATLRK